MPRATCRCGHALTVPFDPNERVVCPGCGSRVRIRRKPVEAPADGFLRFFCPCGRKLKVEASAALSTGKCPDCGRLVPVPSASTSQKPPGHPDAETEELATVDLAARDRWAAGHVAKLPGGVAAVAPPVPRPSAFAGDPTDRKEVGLRVCPKCGSPVHLGASACRSCGTPVAAR